MANELDLFKKFMAGTGQSIVEANEAAKAQPGNKKGAFESALQTSMSKNLGEGSSWDKTYDAYVYGNRGRDEFEKSKAANQAKLGGMSDASRSSAYESQSYNPYDYGYQKDLFGGTGFNSDWNSLTSDQRNNWNNVSDNRANPNYQKDAKQRADKQNDQQYQLAWLTDQLGPAAVATVPGLNARTASGDLAVLGNIDREGYASGTGEGALQGVAGQYNIDKNAKETAQNYIASFDTDDDGVVTPYEQEMAEKALEDQYAGTAYAEMNNGDLFDFRDDGMYHYNPFLASIGEDPWQKMDSSMYSDGRLNFTLEGQDVGTEADARRMAEYLFFNGYSPDIVLNGEHGGYGDSWASYQFADDDKADAFWRYTMDQNNKMIGDMYNYIYNAQDENGNSIWGDDGYTYDKYLDWLAQQSGDLNNPNDLYYQSLYGDVGLGIHSVNQYFADNNINPYWLDAANTPQEQLDAWGITPEMINASDPSGLGRMGFRLNGDENGVGLADMLTLYGYGGNNIAHNTWGAEELNQLGGLAGLDYTYEVTGEPNESDYDIAGARQRYVNPYRVYQYDEIDPETMSINLNYDDLNAMIAEELALKNLGLRTVPIVKE